MKPVPTITSLIHTYSKFPGDFIFELGKDEFNNLRCQNGTSSWGGRRYLPLAFTEYGVLMLSSVLNSERAIQLNTQIIRVFIKIKELMATNREVLQKHEQLERLDIEQDNKIDLIFD